MVETQTGTAVALLELAEATARVDARSLSKARPEQEPKSQRISFAFAISILLALSGLLIPARPAFSESTRDWITALPREPIHVEAWPEGKKVAVCFILYVEVWGFGHGPNFRPDTATRDPDVVDEAFRQYAINWEFPGLPDFSMNKVCP